MSLINQMLRDLERRAENEKKAIDFDLPRSVATKNDSPDILRILVWGGLALLFLAALGYWFVLQARIVSLTVVTPAVTPVLVAAPPAPPPKPQAPVQPESEQTKKPEPIPAPVPPEAKPAPVPAEKKETPAAEKEPPLPVEEPFPPVRGVEVEGAIDPDRSPSPTLPQGGRGQSSFADFHGKETTAAPREKRAPPSAKPATGTGLKRVRPEDGLFVKAKRAWAAGRMAEAEASLREILELNPGHLPSRLMLGTLLLNENRLAEAVRLTDAVPGGQSGGIGLIVIHARALDGLGQTEEALGYLNRTTPKGQEPPQAVEQLRGAMLQKLGRFNESADVYRRLVSRGSMDAQSWAGFGIALEGAGDRGEALSAYRKALAINNLPPSLTDYLRRRVNLLSNGAPL